MLPPKRSMVNQMNKRRKGNIALFLLLLIGLAILLYPPVSMKWNTYRQNQLISAYENEVKDSATQEQNEEMIQAAQNYSKTLFMPTVPDAFAIRSGVTDAVYEGLLNVSGNGMMGHIVIPSIKVDLPLFHYTTPEVLEKGAGHLLGSALPVGGSSTHSVVSAHRGLPTAVMFTNLDKLEKGDHFYYHVLGQVFAYEVDQIKTVKPSELESLKAEVGEDLSTLVTCTPYGVNSHRLLVRGHRIPYSETAEKEEAEHSHSGVDYKRIFLCVLLGLAVSGLILLFFLKLLPAMKKSRKNH